MARGILSRVRWPKRRDLARVGRIIQRAIGPEPAPPTSAPDEVRLHKDKLRRLYTPTPPWWLESVVHSGDSLEIVGWALAPLGRSENLTFCLNGTPFEEVEYPLDRNLEPIFGFLPGSRQVGLRCRAKRRDLFVNGFAKIERVYRESLAPIAPDTAYYYPEPHPGLPIPDPTRIARVSGNPSGAVYELVGATAYKTLEQALQRATGRSFADFESILDWGVGCGRFARHLHHLGPGRVTGADIDADNLDWCAKNLPFLSVCPLPLHPPSPLPSNGFDLIIGISVFTHLRQPEMFEWLAELRRVARPGAILMMTTLGDVALARAKPTRDTLQKWEEEGFLLAGINEQLQGHIEDPSYYRNTYISSDYALRAWQPMFEVLELCPGLLNQHQDLVVLSARH